MLIGFVCAVAHGAAFPLLMLLFGYLTENFIFHEVSTQLAQNVSSLTGINVTCSSIFNYTIGNVTFVDTTIDMILKPPTSIYAECLLSEEFISVVNRNVYALVGVTVGVFLACTIQIATFQFAAERQVHKIRLRYYRAIMRQNIAWFDANPTGGLVSRLSE